MQKLWSNLLVGVEEASRTVVFSGGAANMIVASGPEMLVLNMHREPLNDFLDARAIPFFDPQIHPITHGRAYDYEIDGPAEKAARKAAKILVYQMGDESMGVITDKEIREDVLAGRDVIVWFTGQFNDKGRPMFVPRGIELSSSVKTLTGTREVPPHPVVAAQLTEFQKAGTQLRAELWDFLKDRGNVTITGSSAETIEAVRDRLQVAA